MVDELKCSIKLAFVSAKDQTSLILPTFSHIGIAIITVKILGFFLVYVMIAFN